jgi:hypothetical protein
LGVVLEKLQHAIKPMGTDSNARTGSAGFNASTMFTGVMIVSKRIDDYV